MVIITLNRFQIYVWHTKLTTTTKFLFSTTEELTDKQVDIRIFPKYDDAEIIKVEILPCDHNLPIRLN
jgi:hypothetical protein